MLVEGLELKFYGEQLRELGLVWRRLYIYLKGGCGERESASSPKK